MGDPFFRSTKRGVDDIQVGSREQRNMIPTYLYSPLYIYVSLNPKP